MHKVEVDLDDANDINKLINLQLQFRFCSYSKLPPLFVWLSSNTTRVYSYIYIFM